MGIQRPRDHARRERGEVLPQAPREREARQARSFPPRRRTLRRRNRDRQRASIQKATWHRSGATDRTTELVAGTGGWDLSAPPCRLRRRGCRPRCRGCGRARSPRDECSLRPREERSPASSPDGACRDGCGFRCRRSGDSVRHPRVDRDSTRDPDCCVLVLLEASSRGLTID